MAKSMLTTINQIMSIASKAHYLNGGNTSKILAKDKKGIFTIEQVAETLNCDPVELKEVLRQNKIMCGDYVIVEEWGDGEKLSTFALRTLSSNITKDKKDVKAPFSVKVVCALHLSVIPLLIFDHPIMAILALLAAIPLTLRIAYKKYKGEI